MPLCHAQGTDESQASGAASFLSSTPSRLTHSDMGPPAHKTVSLQELAAGKAYVAPRVRLPIRTTSLNGAHANGAPEKGESPAHEQAASCNDAGSHIESECVTPHNQLKVSAFFPMGCLKTVGRVLQTPWFYGSQEGSFPCP